MQRSYGVKFVGIGGALPAKVVKNTDLEKLFDTSDEWIYTRTGIRERRVVSGNESGLTLSVEASRQALSQSKLNPKDIDLVIVATTTPDKFYPTMSCMLQGELGASKAVCFDLSAACSGFVFSIVTAAQFIYTGQYKNVLVVGVDIHSRFIDWCERSVAVLFGDGAGAALISSCLARDDELLGFSIHSEADKNLDLTLDNSNVSFTDFNKNNKRLNFVQMAGRTIYQFALRVVPEIVTNVLDKTNLQVSDIDYFIPHQANQRIVEAVSKKLGFTDSQVVSNIEKVGNTSAASIPLAIAELCSLKKIKTPSKMMLVGFGAGLTWGAAVINWNLKL